MGNRIGYVALAIACAALALSIRASTRGTGAGAGASKGPDVCVDGEARAQLDELRRAVAQRDATIARMGPVPTAAGSAATADALAVPPVDPGPRRYARFEIPNPAVTVTQKDDGLLDIRSSDPELAGSVVEITAITASGEEDKLLVRIPD